MQLANRFLLQLAGDKRRHGEFALFFGGNRLHDERCRFYRGGVEVRARLVRNFRSLPWNFARRASNCGGFFPSTWAAMVQYSRLMKAWISRSRSTIRRRATVCTRPAEIPRFTLSHNSGLTL